MGLCAAEWDSVLAWVEAYMLLPCVTSLFLNRVELRYGRRKHQRFFVLELWSTDNGGQGNRKLEYSRFSG